MSNGEVVKVKKSDLYPVATTLNNGLMSTSDKLFVDRQTKNVLNTTETAIDVFYITGISANAGVFTDILIMSFNNPCRATLTLSTSGGSAQTSIVNTCYIFNTLKTSNHIESASSYKRGNSVIVKVKLYRPVTYTTIHIVSTIDNVGVSSDASYNYNSASDNNLVSATIQ